MIEIDGSQKSGSGTILRLSVALAAITKQPLHIRNIRERRPNPGLKPQHLEAVLTAARLCNAETRGAELNSHELWFKPDKIQGGRFQAEIGTAGSIPMLLMTVLPICAFAEAPVHLHVSKGGTDVHHSSTINYMRWVFLPTLRNMGLVAQVKVQRYGYYPKGMGEVTLSLEPCKTIRPLHLSEFGRITSVEGISVCTYLSRRKVAERQARAAEIYLKEKGYSIDIETVNDESNPIQKGSSLVLWAETDTGAIVGADAIGELRKTSETVGKEAAEKLFKEISARATVDVYLADMLVIYASLSEGMSIYVTRAVSDHLETNIWLVEKILDVRFKVQKFGQLFKIERTR